MAGLRAYNYFCTAFVSILDKKKRGYMEKFTYGFIFDEFDVDLAGLFTVTCWFGQTSKINKNTTQLSLNLDFRQFTPIPTVFSRLNYSDNYLQVTISDGTFWWISSVVYCSELQLLICFDRRARHRLVQAGNSWHLSYSVFQLVFKWFAVFAIWQLR